MGNRYLVFIALIVAAGLSDCGTYTPDKDAFVGDPIDKSSGASWQGSYEKAIVDHISCEIGDGLKKVQDADGEDFPWLLNDWGVTVSQTITVEDQTGLSPGITPTTILKNGFFPFPAASGGNVTLAQSFSFSLGGTASANALRTETIQYTFRNADILKYYKPGCHHTNNGVMIDGDLKIREFIYDKAQVAMSGSIQLYSADNTEAPYNTFTEEITFVGSYGASATPTWHLARLSADQSANLLVGLRTNTNDLVITLGAVKCPSISKFKSTIEWSGLLSRLKRGEVQSAVVHGPEIVGVYEDGKTFRTKARNGREAVEALKANQVQITFQAANDQKVQECPAGGPVVLADNAMSQHQARVQAAAIAVSVTGQTH